MDQIGALLTAPVEPWDALVCTSKAGKNAVLRFSPSGGTTRRPASGGRRRPCRNCR